MAGGQRIECCDIWMAVHSIQQGGVLQKMEHHHIHTERGCRYIRGHSLAFAGHFENDIFYCCFELSLCSRNLVAKAIPV